MEGFHLLLATPKNTTSERGAPDSKSMYKLSVSTLNQENALRLPQKRSGVVNPVQVRDTAVLSSV